MRPAGGVLFAAALAVALPFSVCWGQTPDQADVHRMAAIQYEIPGLVDEAVAEWIRVLALSPQDAEARARVDALVKKQMPRWLPEEAKTAAPFRCEVLEWRWQERSASAEATADKGLGGRVAGATAPAQQRFLVTEVDFAAREGERWDELHERGFAHTDYGYVWTEAKRRYEARVVVHWEEPSQSELAQKALRATLVFYTLAREQLGFDPTRPWGDPVDIWVTNKGEPGARAQGRSIYLYAARTERASAEWLREIAHEYGHVSFPGIGGFTETSDPWADGELAELLFAKWLGGETEPRGEAEGTGGLRQQATRSASSGRAEATGAYRAPEWMPWSVAEWETEAKGEGQRLVGLWPEAEAAKLIGQETRSCPTVLNGADKQAREAFVGLALRVEEAKGPRYLGEVLKKGGRGNAEGFVRALGKQR
jgi:hypothetical protein